MCEEGVAVEDSVVQLVPFLCFLKHDDGVLIGVLGDVLNVVVDVAYASVTGVPCGYHDVD